MDGGDRRRFPRLQAGLPVEIRPLIQPLQWLEGSLSRDLSTGGLRVTMGRFLPRNSQVVMQFAPPGTGRKLRAVGRVSWVRERPFGDFHDCGLEFVEISADDREAIAGLVERGAVFS